MDAFIEAYEQATPLTDKFRDFLRAQDLDALGAILKRGWSSLEDDLPGMTLPMLVYATDRTLLSTAARPHGIAWGKRMNASLDHAVWIHHEVELDGWLLYASESPVAHAARGLIFGGIFHPDGRRIASVAQEGLIRVRR